ncbi:TetR/AcrR family transcriptional regulator [Alkalicoccobacillus plakortidis]|uniref:TetR/AcrR family transcriptional regulator n=1 Tax=Alkalicoccobacillus plakortidis TaxID=444060 RepID=A0ABT0XIE7_9BACI|nr:TetR/AcrR family transcriptional regulator [Alkalicoccobacillus plakortidis]MCM2675676.1 TetR/AcrR family transcriptional regulator [Alkalicoccobacillus plakortidis]
MSEKNQLIIESAIKLFSINSISSTSIQDIASESGISKGAFYLHFKSKDALLIAIIDYYSDMITKSIQNKAYDTLPAREQYIHKLTDLFECILQHKDFILVQMREPSIPLTEEMKSSLKRLNYKSNQFHQSYLQQLYGDEAKPFVWDLTFMIDGLFHSYLKFLIYAPVIDIRDLVHFVIKRLDSLVEGLDAEQALLSDELISPFMTEFYEEETSETVPFELSELRSLISELENKDDLLVSIDILEEETNQQNPRLPVIQGMLLNLHSESVLRQAIQKLVTHYHLNDSLFND